MGVRVIVDGQLHSLTLDRFTSTPSSAHYIKIVFPTARVRQITVELEGISRFGGVIVPTGHTITRPPRSVRRPFGIIGDSFCRGADYANDGASGLETFAYYVARLSGADRIVNFAIGGTGWSSPGSNSIFGSHTAEVLSSGGGGPDRCRLPQRQQLYIATGRRRICGAGCSQPDTLHCSRRASTGCVFNRQ